MKPSGERSVGKSETLLQVKDAEAKAKLLIEQADEKQRTIIAAARREAVDKVQKAEQDQRSKSESVLSQERVALASQRDELLRKGNEEAASINHKAKDRVPKAKTMIKQKFERTLDAATGTNE